MEGREEIDVDTVAFQAGAEIERHVESDAVLGVPMPTSSGSAPDGWYDMATAPDDGKAIQLLGPDGQRVEAVWRNSRGFDPVGGKWRQTAFWAVRNAGGLRVDWEPLGWKPL
jgi:hypothetical protein